MCAWPRTHVGSGEYHVRDGRYGLKPALRTNTGSLSAAHGTQAGRARAPPTGQVHPDVYGTTGISRQSPAAGAVSYPPMRRRLFTLAAGVSTVLCVGACVLWVRSEQTCDRFSRKDERVPARTDLLIAASYRGAVWLYHETYDARFRQRRAPDLSTDIGSGDFPDLLALLAFEVLSGDQPADVRIHWPLWRADGVQGNGFDGSQLLICPHWLLALASSLVPAAWLAVRRRRYTRRRRGLCPACGYDLRATPDRCPECGLVPVGAPSDSRV